jgi:hypothetical protein
MAVFSGFQNAFRDSGRRLSGNSPGRCRLLRHYSSRAQAESVPLLPVFGGLPPRDVLIQTPISSDTRNKESLADSPVDFLDHAPTFSTALEDDPLSVLPNIHDNSQRVVKKSGIHHGHYSLFQRLMHLYTSSPHASIQSLVLYHGTFPDQQSSRSYNLLLRLAIRHSAFGTARAVLQAMRASRVPENQTTWKLCVRLLVREGRWSDAYNLVFNLPKTPSRAPFISDGVPITVWAELLGTVKRRAFRGLERDPGMYTLSRYSHVMHQLPKLGVSSMDTPPPQVVYASVAALLRMQEREAARQVTSQFLSIDPKGLGLQLLHLHVAAEPRRHSLMTFYRAIQDLQGFRMLCPELEPNGTTLFLLLGHLKRVKRCGIIGHNLVQWFRRRWGNSVVSPRVERRLLALAVKEKGVNLIKEWVTCVKPRPKIWWMWSLEREVVDGAAPKRRSVTQQPHLRFAKAGAERLVVNRLLRRVSRMLKSESPKGSS